MCACAKQSWLNTQCAYGFHTIFIIKQRLFPWTALTSWCLWWTRCVLFGSGYEQHLYQRFSAGIPQLVPKGSTTSAGLSWIFIVWCCIAETSKHFFVTFLLPHWSKKMMEKLYRLSVFDSILILFHQNIWDNFGQGPCHHKGWGTMIRWRRASNDWSVLHSFYKRSILIRSQNPRILRKTIFTEVAVFSFPFQSYTDFSLSRNLTSLITHHSNNRLNTPIIRWFR
jgi:hypothetical protein